MTPVNRGHVYFEIQADDLRRAADFYAKVFDWSLEPVNGLPVEYLSIQTGGSKGGLLKRPARIPPPECGTNAFVCSFEVENFDGVEQKILSLGGQVALPKFPAPGICWQGYFVDTEGNTFGIFQVDETAGG